MVLGGLPIKPEVGEFPRSLAGLVIHGVVKPGIELRTRGNGRARRFDIGDDASDKRIGRVGKALCCGKLGKIDGASRAVVIARAGGYAGRPRVPGLGCACRIGEQSVGSVRGQNLAGEWTSLWTVIKIEIGKEKQLVLKNRTADPVTILLQPFLPP